MCGCVYMWMHVYRPTPSHMQTFRYMHKKIRSTQSFFTGGLGEVARKSSAAAKQYGVWACVKDWNSTQQLLCGTGPGRLACFKYEEVSGKFEFWGLNADLRLIFKSDSERSTFV